MLILPAIDIIGGKCVRLTQGDYSKVKNYAYDPIKIAQKFKADGAAFLHIIDLEGAKQGKPVNFEKIIEISKIADLQVGGGIRTAKDARNYLKNGIKRVILGTSAIKNPSIIKSLIDEFGSERVAVSVDVKNDEVMVAGWIKNSGKKLIEVLGDLKKTGLKLLIFTDIAQDGMLKGLNLENIKKVAKSGFEVIIAGGVSTYNDINNLKELDVYGCIIGKALYEGKIDLSKCFPNNLAKRIIPCMDIKEGRVVKGVHFKELRDAGDPVELGKIYSDMGADELVFLDIMATVENRKTLYNLVKKIAENINIPFTVGGGIKSLEDIRMLLNNGADKVSIGSYATENLDFIKKAAKQFGSQCIVISVDPKWNGSKWEIYIRGGRTPTGIDAIEFSKQMEELGAGELLVNSLDRDGTKKGYDLKLLKAIVEAVNIPVIASSGAGCEVDFLKAFEYANVDAALAASLFHYGQLTIPDLKKYLNNNSVTVRI
ncbi:imidazole glycerol phosphate synthase subunit HisF [Patescibacteria group bacterium]